MIALPRRSGGGSLTERMSPRVSSPTTPWTTLGHYLLGISAVALAAAICFSTGSIFGIAEQAMLHLVAVLLVASRLPRWPALTTAVLAVASLDFLFVEPYYTLAVYDVRYVVTFAVMLAVGLLVSGQ